MGWGPQGTEKGKGEGKGTPAKANTVAPRGETLPKKV